MRTKLFFTSLLLSTASFIFAQESDVPGYKTSFKAGGFGDNWFIQIGAGGQTAFADKNHDGPDIQDRITLAPTFALGKWFNPFFGFRIKGDGGALHGFQNEGAYMIHDHYYAAHFNFLWNMASYYGSYKPNRVFGFIPYIGLGYIHRNENDQIAPAGAFVPAPNFKQAYDGLTWNGGIMMTFRLSKHVDFHVDFGGILAEDELNRIMDSSNYDFILSATGGFTFKLGKSEFEVVQPMDYGLINDLNNRINGLRAENSELSKRPVSCPECPEIVAAEIVEKEIVGAPAVVKFRIGSAQIDANQELGIYNTSQFVKNSGEKVRVVGYADKKTGTAAYNMKLSEQRAKAVAKELMSKYNIPSQSIIVEWKGSDEQPYAENDWNRVVIMKVKE